MKSCILIFTIFFTVSGYSSVQKLPLPKPRPLQLSEQPKDRSYRPLRLKPQELFPFLDFSVQEGVKLDPKRTDKLLEDPKFFNRRSPLCPGSETPEDLKIDSSAILSQIPKISEPLTDESLHALLLKSFVEEQADFLSFISDSRNWQIIDSKSWATVNDMYTKIARQKEKLWDLMRSTTSIETSSDDVLKKQIREAATELSRLYLEGADKIYPFIKKILGEEPKFNSDTLDQTRTAFQKSQSREPLPLVISYKCVQRVSSVAPAQGATQTQATD